MGQYQKYLAGFDNASRSDIHDEPTHQRDSETDTNCEEDNSDEESSSSDNQSIVVELPGPTSLDEDEESDEDDVYSSYSDDGEQDNAMLRNKRSLELESVEETNDRHVRPKLSDSVVNPTDIRCEYSTDNDDSGSNARHHIAKTTTCQGGTVEASNDTAKDLITRQDPVDSQKNIAKVFALFDKFSNKQLKRKLRQVKQKPMRPKYSDTELQTLAQTFVELGQKPSVKKIQKVRLLLLEDLRTATLEPKPAPDMAAPIDMVNYKHWAVPDVHLSAKDMPPPPKNRSEAQKSSFWKYWKRAEEAELYSLHVRNTWAEVKRPVGRKILKCKWVYTYKIDWKLDKIIRFKARLVACGYSQVEGVDFQDTFSPVAKIQSVRILSAITMQYSLKSSIADITTAYLYAKLETTNYMQMPPGYVTYEKGVPNVCELIHSIYGLKQAARDWNLCVTNHLRENGYEPLRSDPCVFMKTDPVSQKRTYVAAYVDDFLIISSSEELIAELKSVLRKRFETVDMDGSNRLLGIKYERFENSVYLGQPDYAQKILEGTGMWNTEVNGRTVPVDSVLTPMVESFAHLNDSPELNPARAEEYRSVLMKLSYLAQQTRPDLVYSVNVLAQKLQKPDEHSNKALKRILRYLRGTHDLGLHYVRTNRGMQMYSSSDPDNLDDGNFFPEIFADASFGDGEDRKSRSGHCVIVNGAAVTWYSKKQTVIALSSTESEYYSLAEAVKECLWIRQFLTELGLRVDKPTKINQDNQSTIAIALNPIQHQRVKHIDIKVHFLKEHLRLKDCELVYCNTKEMIADIFTKPLGPNLFRKFTLLLGLRSLADLSGKSLIPSHTKDLRV
jgi:hypothetical protein